MDEETNIEEKEEQEPITEGGTQPDETPVETQPVEPTPPAPTEETPEDPLTMTCDEMRDRIIDLSSQRAHIVEEERRLEDLKEYDKDLSLLEPGLLEKPCKDCEEKKQNIDNEITTLFDHFTVCTTKPVEEEKPKEEPTV